eukprot:Sspe_Gene.105539::Locus_82564_Transcript_2_3_Confidence_0.714_Length_462::g.105539::m.105539
MTGALPQLKDTFHLSSTQEGWLVAMSSFGQLPGALAAGWIADRIGRRYTIMLQDFIFATGCLTMGLAHSLWVLCLGRAILGLGFALSMVGNVAWVSELAPASVRGR